MERRVGTDWRSWKVMKLSCKMSLRLCEELQRPRWRAEPAKSGKLLRRS